MLYGMIRCIRHPVALGRSVPWIQGRHQSTFQDRIPEYFISVDELATRLTEVKVFDTTWSPQTTKEDLRTLFERERIATSRYFPIDDIANLSVVLPHALPTPETFEIWMENFGVRRTDPVVLYSKASILSAARVLWTFHIYGHDQVRILRGGFPLWKGANKPMEGSPFISPLSDPQAPEYHPEFRKDRLVAYEGIQANLARVHTSDFIPIFDTRPREEYHRGHIPHAINIPFPSLLERSEEGYLDLSLNEENLIQLTRSVPLDGPSMVHCTSGITSCTLYLACRLLGKDRLTLYPGSFLDYLSHPDAPVEKG